MEKMLNLPKPIHKYLTICQHRLPLMGLLLITSLGIFPSKVSAAVSSNTDYYLQFNKINTENIEPSPKISNSNQSTNQPSASSPYTISHTNDSFSFKLSTTTIDFGLLSASNPVIRTSDMNFADAFFGGQVITYEDHALTTEKKDNIPDTTCDNGLCNEMIAAPWTNSLAYGFGYRCESSLLNVCDNDFLDIDTFKQFPNRSANESEKTIILNGQPKQETKTKIIYKVNVSGTQPQGDYSNTITYIAIPNF